MCCAAVLLCSWCRSCGSALGIHSVIMTRAAAVPCVPAPLLQQHTSPRDMLREILCVDKARVPLQ